MAKFAIYIVPRSKRPGPYGRHGGLPRLRVSAPASEGRANREAELLLTDLLSARVSITAGHHSRKKTFETDLAAATLERRLLDVFPEPLRGGVD